MEFDLLYMDAPARERETCARDLIRDLKLDLVLDVMSGGSKAVYDACVSVLTSPLADARSVRMRNAVVQDVVMHGEVFESLLTVAGEMLARTRKHAEFVKPKYDKVISCCNKIVNETEIAQIFMEGLHKLNALLRTHRHNFRAEGLVQLCDAAKDTISDEYLSRIRSRIEELSTLRQGGGVSVSGRIGEGLKQADVVLNRSSETARKTRRSLAARSAAIPLSSITLVKNAQEITEKALTPVYRIIAGFNRAVQRFFEKLDFQLKFLVGCFRLHERLVSLGVPVCYPEFADGGRHEARALVDAGLALKDGNVPVGNGASFSGKRLVMITGPNQGGKTTFLRSVGLAQLMAQCGMFVTAGQYVCPVYTGIFTHFPNGEDARMQNGLLEVELSKLSRLVDVLKPGALLLMNESFQTTTPGDAKRLAAEIVPALLDAGIRVLFVTHLYGYAMDVFEQKSDDTLFLRAQRSLERTNTYCLQEGPPFKSAFGLILFREVMQGS